MTTTSPGRAATGDAVAEAGRAAVGARTLRTDRWWLQPLLTVAALVAFIVYSTLRAFENANYYAAPYISPFYSPCITTRCEGSHFPQLFSRGRRWISPALYILVIPLGFRLTCYYYRKAYYRSFWLSPPACAVAEPHRTYTGETRFPLVFQNVHRYFFYLGLVFNVILTYDAVLAFRDARRRVVPHGPRHAGARRQRGAAVAVLAVLPLLPARRRRPAQALLGAPGPLPRLDAGLAAERPAHAAGLGQPGRGRR